MITKSFYNPAEHTNPLAFEKRGTIYKYFRKSVKKAFLDSPVHLTFEIRKDMVDGRPTYLEGVASDNKIDFDGERMTDRALSSMNAQINNGSIPLLYGHKQIKIGDFVGSTLQGGQLYVRTKLDDPEINPASQQILRLMGNGMQFGFSIGGDVLGRELHNGKQEFVEVNLKEISLVEQPANARAQVTALVRKKYVQ